MLLLLLLLSRSVISDSVQPHRRQPTRLRRPWDSQCKNTGVGCHFFLQCMKVKSEIRSVLPNSSRPHGLLPNRLLCPQDFSYGKIEYWSGVPLPSPICMSVLFNCEYNLCELLLRNLNVFLNLEAFQLSFLLLTSDNCIIMKKNQLHIDSLKFDVFSQHRISFHKCSFCI